MHSSNTQPPASFKIRPRFEVETSYAVDELVTMIRKSIESDENIRAKISEGHATLYIREDRQHYWSPQLTLSICESDNGCILQGVYGPRPSVWTMFIFFYAIIGFAILLVALFGFTNRSLGNPAPILWLIPVLMVVFLSFYLTSYFGQRLGRDEIKMLHAFVERSIDTKI